MTTNNTELGLRPADLSSLGDASPAEGSSAPEPIERRETERGRRAALMADASPADVAFDAFLARMQAMRRRGEFKRVAAQAMLEPRLLLAMQECAEWCEPVQHRRSVREASDRVNRATAARQAAEQAARLEKLAVRSRTTGVQLPAPRIGAEHHTRAAIARRAASHKRWQRRLNDQHTVVAERLASDLPYEQWLLNHPHYGPERPQHWLWEAMQDAKRRRRDYSRLLRLQTTTIRPVGMPRERAFEIAATVLAQHGSFPKPDTFEQVAKRLHLGI